VRPPAWKRRRRPQQSSLWARASDAFPEAITSQKPSIAIAGNPKRKIRLVPVANLIAVTTLLPANDSVIGGCVVGRLRGLIGGLFCGARLRDGLVGGIDLILCGAVALELIARFGRRVEFLLGRVGGIVRLLNGLILLIGGVVGRAVLIRLCGLRRVGGCAVALRAGD